MAPGNPLTLEAKTKSMGKTLEDITIPVGSVKLFKGGRGTALEIPVLPNPKEATLEAFRGWGITPLLLQVDENTRPETEVIRREMWAFLKKCRGHNNVSGVGEYYADVNPTPWPTKEAKVLKPEDLWPDYKAIWSRELQQPNQVGVG